MRRLLVDARDDVLVLAAAQEQDRADSDGETDQERHDRWHADGPQHDAWGERSGRRPDGDLLVAVHPRSG